jgi:hypothetical protein
MITDNKDEWLTPELKEKFLNLRTYAEEHPFSVEKMILFVHQSVEAKQKEVALHRLEISGEDEIFATFRTQVEKIDNKDTTLRFLEIRVPRTGSPFTYQTLIESVMNELGFKNPLSDYHVYLNPNDFSIIRITEPIE